MKRIVIFSGAGISKESGIETFRDTKDGLWYNFNVEDVATIEGWNKDNKKVLDFYNLRRSMLKDVFPNEAHKALVKLEEDFDVTVVTQNVDDLHERAGSSNVLHLHGELYKSRSSLDINLLYDCTGNIEIGDKCVKGSQLRPHVVFFGEYPFNVIESYRAIEKADYLLIVGTSLQISYTLNMLKSASPTCKMFYIDPSPMHYLDNYGMKVNYINKIASEGVSEIVDKLINEEI